MRHIILSAIVLFGSIALAQPCDSPDQEGVVQKTFYDFARSMRCLWRESTTKDSANKSLWDVVGSQCAESAKMGCKPVPCEAYDSNIGYAVLKDTNPEKPTRFLLIPTKSVSGIEDRSILSPDSPNYWKAAWQNRAVLEKAAKRKLARDEIAFAINKPSTRSESQLHIHMDCAAKGMSHVLKSHEAEIGISWSSRKFHPLRETWCCGKGPEASVMKIESDDLDGYDPFKLVAQRLQNPAEMKKHIIVLTGATFTNGKNGFYLMDIDGPSADFGAETYLDNCVKTTR